MPDPSESPAPPASAPAIPVVDAVPATTATESTATNMAHHGEALVAALLNTQHNTQPFPGAADGAKVINSGGTAPLTASSFFNSTTGEVIDARPDDLTAAQPGLGVLAVTEAVDYAIDEEPPRPPVEEGSDEPSDDDGDKNEDRAFARNVLEWIVVLGAAVAVAIILRTFVFQAFYIPSESMETTLYKDDRLLVNKVSYRLHDVNRGDVVVFRRPDDQPGEIRDLIKRVIGLPGETVEGRGGVIYIDDQQLVEPYLDGNPFSDFAPVTVPEGHYFMMGDNRDESLDSRRFGPIDEDRIVGRAFVLFWPFDRVGTL